MKYDDASWHYGGNFPKGLPHSAGATHIGMFVAWAALNGMAGELHVEDFASDLGKLKDHSFTPAAWFLSVCDEKFTDEDLNTEGNEFAKVYYAGTEGLHTSVGSYLADYSEAFPTSETLYHVPDTWATFTTLDPLIRARFDAWKKAQ